MCFAKWMHSTGTHSPFVNALSLYSANDMCDSFSIEILGENGCCSIAKRIIFNSSLFMQKSAANRRIGIMAALGVWGEAFVGPVHPPLCRYSTMQPTTEPANIVYHDGAKISRKCCCRWCCFCCRFLHCIRFAFVAAIAVVLDTDWLGTGRTIVLLVGGWVRATESDVSWIMILPATNFFLFVHSFAATQQQPKAAGRNTLLIIFAWCIPCIIEVLYRRQSTKDM